MAFPGSPAARSAAVVVLAAAVVAALAGARIVREHGREERRLLEDRAATLAGALAGSLSEAMHEHRPGSMGAILGALARTEGVSGLAIADRAGVVRHAAGDVPSRIPPPARAAYAWSDRRLALTRPLDNGPACQACHGGAAGVNGSVHVALDATALAPRLARTA